MSRPASTGEAHKSQHSTSTNDNWLVTFHNKIYGEERKLMHFYVDVNTMFCIMHVGLNQHLSPH